MARLSGVRVSAAFQAGRARCAIKRGARGPSRARLSLGMDLDIAIGCEAWREKGDGIGGEGGWINSRRGRATRDGGELAATGGRASLIDGAGTAA